MQATSHLLVADSIGELAAFEQLVRHLARHVYRYEYRVLRVRWMADQHCYAVEIESDLTLDHLRKAAEPFGSSMRVEFAEI